MKKYEQLEEKILSMSFKEILLAMIDSIENPVTELDMSTFGFKVKNTCYGCAATNTICKIGNLNPVKELYSYKRKTEKRKYSAYSGIIYNFEKAIDYLRQGCIPLYNIRAKYTGFATCEIEDVSLPILDKHEDILTCLEQYKKFAQQL